MTTRRRKLSLAAIGTLVAERYPQWEYYTATHADVAYIGTAGHYLVELDATAATAKLTVALDCPGVLAAHLVADLYALPYKVVVTSRPMLHTTAGRVAYDDDALDHWSAYQRFMYAAPNEPLS